MQFTDNKGRRWTFPANTFTFARCKKETGIDLAKSVEPGTDDNPNTILDSVLGDIGVFFDVVGSLLQDELATAGVTLRELGESMDEEKMIDAAGALVDAVLSFSPADRAKPMRAAFDRFWGLTRQKANTKAAAAMDRLAEADFETLAEEIANGETPETAVSKALTKAGSQDSSGSNSKSDAKTSDASESGENASEPEAATTSSGATSGN